jgi:ribosomal protein S6
MEKTTIYEIGYHLLPILPDDEVAGRVGFIKDTITKGGGVIISEEYPKLITLAYEIGKKVEDKGQSFGTAHFGWVKFEVPTNAIEAIKGAFDLEKTMLRFILVKTVRENTIMSKTVLQSLEEKSRDRVPEVATEKEEIIPAEVDAEIEKLIDDVTPEAAE